jgi:hypothetical protein
MAGWWNVSHHRRGDVDHEEEDEETRCRRTPRRRTRTRRRSNETSTCFHLPTQEEEEDRCRHRHCWSPSASLCLSLSRPPSPWPLSLSLLSSSGPPELLFLSACPQLLFRLALTLFTLLLFSWSATGPCIDGHIISISASSTNGARNYERRRR